MEEHFMKKLLAVLVLSALVCISLSALAVEWPVTSIADFSEGASLTTIGMSGNDGQEYQGFIDIHGQLRSYLPANEITYIFKISDHYASVLVGRQEYAILDAANGRTVASSKSGGFDRILDIGSWNGHTYYATIANVSGFSAKGYQYTICNENGNVVWQETMKSQLQSVNYGGEGWFLLHNGSEALYCCAATGKTVTVPSVSNYCNSVENGYTVNITKGASKFYETAVLINLNNGATQVFGMYGNAKGANAVMIGPFNEGKAVVTEYNSLRTQEPVIGMYYIQPGRGAVQLNALIEHVKAPMVSMLQFCRFENGRLLLPLQGADGKSYVGVVDENDRVVVEPFRADSMYMYTISSGRLVTMLDGVAQVYDENGRYLFSASDYHETRIGIFHEGIAPMSKYAMIDRNGELVFYGSVSLDGAVRFGIN